MSEFAIRVQNLSKQYTIEAGKARYDSLSDQLAGSLKSLIRRNGHLNSQDSEFWALNDVSFEVKQGEVVGVIGRNGAGKSTLLKILSRITEPTSGRAEIYGRVGSLLEVGTGFDRELTGRENIYLNGAVLGMKKAEIKRKFDEILAFAEVEKFIDTPVKHYSSGMYVRLAFAVAAHLEPDILIVDEVLAVGDALFQQKCLGKMREVTQVGRTVIFVSHDMPAVINLCSNAILLKNGELKYEGDPRQAVELHLNTQPIGHHAEHDLSECPTRSKGCFPLFKRVRLVDRQGQPASTFYCGDEVFIDFDLFFPWPVVAPQIGIGFDNWWDQRICSVATYLSTTPLPPLVGSCSIRCRIPQFPLAPGTYTLSLSVGNLQQPLIDHIEHTVALEVLPSDFFGNGRLPSVQLGQTLLRSEWLLVSTYQVKHP